MRTFYAALAAVLCLGCATGAPRFEKQLGGFRSQLSVPGLSAVIVQDGRVVWAGAYGYADVEHHVSATPETPYEIASLSKPIGATLLMQLVEQGRVSLDDPLSKYSEEVKRDAVKVRHVLTHTAEGNPGEKYEYNGNAFDLLTDVVIKASGNRYRVLLADNIIDPLRMTNTSPGNDIADGLPNMEKILGEARARHYANVLSRLAKPYKLAKDGKFVLSEEPNRGIGTANGVVTTVLDYAKFDAAVDAHKLVSAATQEQMWTNARTNDGKPIPYGFGWFVQNIGGTRVIWHNGYLPDRYSALYVKVPAKRLTLIVFANSDALSAGFELAKGDVTRSPIARAFLSDFGLLVP
ncbi:MAG TPA: serine hydrolase domain-containing protein [Thermoanaerobaculia bacterium]|jgi:CubicO group peptidase (beta-lactamase class C family)|nr:serine hydrolase domain-containing protein [Thermoanaerobaculia bacterium]